MNNYDVEGARGLLTFQGRPIISINDGQRIGTVDDVLVDPAAATGAPHLHGLVTAKSGILRSEINAIPAGEVFLWGQDAVLVKRSDAMVKRDTLPGLETCLSAYQSLPGRDVISQSGDRLAELRDLLITPQGELAGFVIDRIRGELLEVMGERRGERRLPSSAIESFGRDVLILNLNKVREMDPPAQTDLEEVS